MPYHPPRRLNPSASFSLLLLVLALASCCSHPQTAIAPSSRPAPTAVAAFDLQPGDLLFQDSDGGPLSDAIKTVTTGYQHARFSHMGMVVSSEPGQVQVIEAVGKSVKVTPLDHFLPRSHDAAGHPKVLVGRLKPEFRPLIQGAVTFAMAQRGKPYDKCYKMNGDSYYCSSLIYDAFLHANHGQALFVAAPMTFKDPTTGQFFLAWTDYFAKLQVPIPEGEPGVNPGAMSRADCLEIVHAFGEPSRSH